jgi:hypothetical protein
MDELFWRRIVVVRDRLAARLMERGDQGSADGVAIVQQARREPENSLFLWMHPDCQREFA